MVSSFVSPSPGRLFPPCAFPASLSAVRRPSLRRPPVRASLRRRLLGDAAVSRESARLRHMPRSRLVLTRSIVIFADYLSDLVVLDVLTDLSRSPNPFLALSAAFAGLLGAFAAADLASALAAWLSWTYLHTGAFDIFGAEHVTGQGTARRRYKLAPPTEDVIMARAHRLRRASQRVDATPVVVRPASPKVAPNRHAPVPVVVRVTEHVAPLPATSTVLTAVTAPQPHSSAAPVSSVAHRPSPQTQPEPAESKDIFEKLVNSCALVTPPLTVVAGWTPSSSDTFDIFWQTFLVSTFSFLALSPMIRQRGPDCPVVTALRWAGLLKPHGAPGWSQINGLWDEPLRRTQVLARAEVIIEKVAQVSRKREGLPPAWRGQRNEPP